MPRSSVTTELVTVLFTDIVSSTEIASEVGDKRWRALVAAHHGLVRQALRRYRGREIDTAGDGFFASFPRPADAIRCACDVAEGVRQFGLEIRAGVHLGEAEIMGGKVGGLVVNTGARIMSIGTAGEVLVSATVREAVAGKGIGFADHGVHQLKGIEGEYRISVVTTVDERPVEPPLDPSEAMRRRTLPHVVPGPDRRWRVAAAVAIAAVVAAGGFVLSWSGADDPSPHERDPSGASGAPRPLTAADRELLALVPETYATSCAPTDRVPVGPDASITCIDRDIEVRFETFASVGELEDAFTLSTAGVTFDGERCRDDVTAKERYEVNGTDRGSVACWVDREVLGYRASIAWTDEQLLVLAVARFQVSSTFRGNVPDLSLYAWWSEEAGPTETGIVSPKDDPIEVVDGTFAMTIGPSDVGPVNEGGADPNWAGQYRITFDGATFDETSAGAYHETSGLLWGKPDRVILVRHYTFPPSGGVTAPCQKLESFRWELEGDTLFLTDPSPEPECPVFRDVASFRPWERV